MRTKDYPNIGDLVVCTIKDVKAFGAFARLDEYNREGFIHIKDVASGWVKYIKTHVREGQKTVCRVLRVDKQREHIDLSLRQVNAHQRRDKINEWKNEQKAEKLFEIVAERYGKDLQTCNREFGYKLVDKYGSLYSAFEEATIDPKALEDTGFKGEWLKHFVDIATENIQAPYVVIDGNVDITCPSADGVVHIREALSAVEDENITAYYVGAPKYRVRVRALDYKTAEDEFKRAGEAIVKHIKEHGGRGKYYRR